MSATTATRPAYTVEETREITDTIRRQIGIGTFMRLGASQLTYYRTHPTFPLLPWPGLAFLARLHRQAQFKVRVMAVYVTLTPADTYAIHIRERGSEEMRLELTDVYAEDLARVLLDVETTGV